MATEDGGKNSQGGVICVLPNGETQTDAELLEELTGIMAKVHVDAPSVIDAFVADISKGANQMMDDAEKEALKAEIKNEILKELKAEGAESFSWTDAARGAKLRPFLLAKQSEEKKQVLNFRMEKGYLDVLDLWAEKRGIKTRTAALKAMILELGDD
jgi:hypothetical protein|tara:strand:- start:524 stop:994 length:471 start_codon:yes stop_codon:yes gene_type:complete